MIKSRHVLIGAGAVAAIYFGGSYLLKLNRLSNELESETKVSIHNVSLSGIELSINVKLKNPSGGSVSFPRVATLECNNCCRKPLVGMWDTLRRFVRRGVFHISTGTPVA